MIEGDLRPGDWVSIFRRPTSKEERESGLTWTLLMDTMLNRPLQVTDYDVETRRFSVMEDGGRWRYHAHWAFRIGCAQYSYWSRANMDLRATIRSPSPSPKFPKETLYRKDTAGTWAPDPDWGPPVIFRDPPW